MKEAKIENTENTVKIYIHVFNVRDDGEEYDARLREHSCVALLSIC